MSDLSFGDIAALIVTTAVMVWILLMSWAAHQQYMLGHDTWLFSHKTELEKNLQSEKVQAIAKGPL